VNVYFDDLKITHRKSRIVQKDDYYPFGLTFNSYQRPNTTEQRWKFQGQEHIDDLGLNWDSFKWRNHQPDIGRFFNVDPLADKYVYNSPYAFSENDVIGAVELEGLEKARITNWKVQKSIMQKMSTEVINNGDNNWKGTRSLNQFIVYNDKNEVVKAYSSMEVGGSEELMYNDGVRINGIKTDLNYGKLFSDGFSDYRGGMAKQTAKNVGIVALSLIPGSTLLGTASTVEKVLAGADVALKMDDLSKMISNGDMSALEKLVGKDAANTIKLLINTSNTGNGVLNTISNPSVGNVVGTIDSGVSAANNASDKKQKEEDEEKNKQHGN